jgi:gliding motility-associated protein GldM
MAHEKLSPRQKMIGMMYLVLTAMLALNVSKEAVKAFMKVEEGLNKTVKNYEAKNKEIYDLFEAKYAENPVRGGPARAKAFNVKERSDGLFNYIQNLKKEIIIAGEGDKAPAIEGSEIDIYKVVKFDDSNTPSQVLIGANDDGKAFALRAAINDYRDTLIAIVGGKNPAIEAALRSSLSTADGKKEGTTGTPEAWPNNQFQTLPVVAVIAMLSKIQVDVRNAETDVITFLYNEIDKRSFKFNRLVPTVVPVTSTYVMSGSEYEAQVFFAAVDTTQKPVVTVGDVATTGVNPDGTPKYEMIGNNYQTLDYDDAGRGIYKIRPTGMGQHKWGGLITMKAPDGTLIAKPFTANYEVGAQNVVISLTAMNVLYRGIGNPIDISVPGVGQDKVRPTMTNGNLTKGQIKNNTTGEMFPGTFVAEPAATATSVQINVVAEINGKQVAFKPMNYRVKDIPLPQSKFANVTIQGTASLADIKAQPGVFAELKDFDFDLRYTVTKFTVSIFKQGLYFNKESNSNKLTDEQRALLAQLTRGSKLTVENIWAKGPDNKERQIPGIIITVN